MGYDFLTEFSLFPDKNQTNEHRIDDVVLGKGIYANLKESAWTTKAIILSTGLWIDDLKEAIKNGQEEDRKKNKSKIKGYPDIVNGIDTGLDNIWTASFIPNGKDLSRLPSGSCLVQIELKLDSPFFSKDDLAFYPHDNPLKREWIFQVPYLPASSVKGLLRWSWRMCHGDTQKTVEDQLFGPRPKKLEEGSAVQGCLFLYPIFWEGKVGLDVINPHDRSTGTGTKPIKYEVVKPGSKGILSIVLFNKKAETDFIDNVLPLLFDPLQFLLDTGISAKRTSDWGSVKVTECCAWLYGEQFQNLAVEEVEDTDRGTDDATKEEAAKDALWEEVTDEDGNLYAESDGEHITAKILVKLTGSSKTQVRKNRHKVYERLQGLWKERQAPGAQVQEGTSAQDESAAKPSYLQIKDTSFKRWKEKLERLLVNVSDGGTAS